MRDFPGFSSSRLSLAALLVASLAACTSGGGGNGDSTSSGSGSSGSASSCGSTVTLTGRVLAGVPVLGATVVVKDAQAFTRSTTTSTTDGSYSVNIGCLNAPVVVEASGVVAGRPVVLHSFLTGISGSSPVLNVTPLTDAMLALVGGMDPTSFFAAQDFGIFGAVSTDSANNFLQKTVLAPEISAILGSATPNFFTDNVNPVGRSGLDEVLELLNVVLLPSAVTGGKVTSEQVQIISRLNPADRILLGYNSGTFSVVSGSLGTAAEWTANLQGFTGGSNASGFGGIDNFISTLNIDVVGTKTAADYASIAGSKGVDLRNYLNEGFTATTQGVNASYSTAVIESCSTTNSVSPPANYLAPSKNSCVVRLGYSWQSSANNNAVESSFYYDTLLDEGTYWKFIGNGESYPVSVGYRYVQPQFPPSFPGSLLTPTPTGLSVPNPIEQLAITVDTSLYGTLRGTPSVLGVDVYTVNGSGSPQALLTPAAGGAHMLTPALNGLRHAGSMPVTLVLPLTQAQANQLNAANGHVQIQVTVSSGTTPTMTVDRYLTWAMDPSQTDLALAYLPYPALRNDSLSQFLNWDPTATNLYVESTGLNLPTNSGYPTYTPAADVTAILGYNADLTQSSPPYVFAGALQPGGTLVSNQILLNGSLTPLSATTDRKLVIGNEDKDLNHYVTAYCVGTNVVSNCQ